MRFEVATRVRAFQSRRNQRQLTKVSMSAQAWVTPRCALSSTNRMPSRLPPRSTASSQGSRRGCQPWPSTSLPPAMTSRQSLAHLVRSRGGESGSCPTATIRRRPRRGVSTPSTGLHTALLAKRRGTLSRQRAHVVAPCSTTWLAMFGLPRSPATGSPCPFVAPCPHSADRIDHHHVLPDWASARSACGSRTVSTQFYGRAVARGVSSKAITVDVIGGLDV